MQRARKTARAKGLPVPEKLEDIPVKREVSADSSNTTGNTRSSGGSPRKKRVAEMTEEVNSKDQKKLIQFCNFLRGIF